MKRLTVLATVLLALLVASCENPVEPAHDVEGCLDCFGPTHPPVGEITKR